MGDCQWLASGQSGGCSRERFAEAGQAPTHRKALPYDKVPDFLETLKASKAGDFTKLALELLILTASRSGEVRLADWVGVRSGKRGLDAARTA